MKSLRQAGVLAVAMAVTPAFAQTAPQPNTPVQNQSAPVDKVAKVECPPAAAQAQPATPEVAAADATAPSNAGSTGWSGGTGGSHIGTNTSGASAHTQTWQPATARGLDLAGRPDPAPAC